MGRHDTARSISQQERGPLAQILDKEGRRPPEDLVDAAATVRGVVLDVIASTAHHTGLQAGEPVEKLADELVKAVRAKSTRWAFIHLAGGQQ